jgi:hypothetical protein
MRRCRMIDPCTHALRLSRLLSSLQVLEGLSLLGQDASHGDAALSLQDAALPLLPFSSFCSDVPPGTGHPRMEDLAGRGYPAEADLGFAPVCIEIHPACKLRVRGGAGPLDKPDGPDRPDRRNGLDRPHLVALR